LVPSPSQDGQAPNGLLNENSRGSISGIVKPETGQANFAEKIVCSPLSASSVSAMPSARPSAVSNESASRLAMSSRTTTRSTTTSMSCMKFFLRP
jgi:hypothetical protein